MLKDMHVHTRHLHNLVVLVVSSLLDMVDIVVVFMVEIMVLFVVVETVVVETVVEKMVEIVVNFSIEPLAISSSSMVVLVVVDLVVSMIQMRFITCHSMVTRTIKVMHQWS